VIWKPFSLELPWKPIFTRNYLQMVGYLPKYAQLSKLEHAKYSHPCINTKERLGRGSLTDRGSISLIRISIAMALHGAFFKGGKYVPAIFSHHQEKYAASLKSSLLPLARFPRVTSFVLAA